MYAGYVPLGLPPVTLDERERFLVVLYLKTCALLSIEPAPSERALGLMQEWTEVLSRGPEPTKQ